jgi:hypothetical protein
MPGRCWGRCCRKFIPKNIPTHTLPRDAKPCFQCNGDSLQHPESDKSSAVPHRTNKSYATDTDQNLEPHTSKRSYRQSHCGNGNKPNTSYIAQSSRRAPPCTQNRFLYHKSSLPHFPPASKSKSILAVFLWARQWRPDAMCPRRPSQRRKVDLRHRPKCPTQHQLCLRELPLTSSLARRIIC